MGNLDSNELYHHGIFGMKWGVRRYQNSDGTLTEAGKKRYYNDDGSFSDAGKKRLQRDASEVFSNENARKQKGAALYKEVDSNEYIKKAAERMYADEIYLNESYREVKKDPSNQKAVDEYRRAYDIYQNNVESLSKEILGKYANTKVNGVERTSDAAVLVKTALGNHARDLYRQRDEIKKASLDRAKKNDSWDLNFLETVQNDPVLQKGGKELLNEYSKYLDNPRKYMHEFKSSEYANKTNPMNTVKKVFDNSSKDPKDFNKIYQKAMEEAEKSDPDFYDKKLDDVMDAYLLDLFDQEATKKAKHSDLSEDFLEHWGILGMKWGVRRYQNKDGSLTSAGRKRYASGKNVGFFEARRLKKKRAEAAKKRQATLEAKRKSEEDAQKHEAEKQEAIRSGNATQIAKFQNELSNQELRDALDRLNSKQRLSDLVEKETPKKETKLDKAMKIAEKGAKYADIAEKGIKVYNTFAKVSNAFADDDSQLPIIGEKREKKEVKEAPDKKKEAAIRSGDPEQLKKWQGKLTPEEVKTAKLTVDYWNSINDKTVSNTKKEQKTGEEAAHSILDQIANSSSQYDPNEHQNTLWRNNFNPIEDRRKERAAQDKRIEELIKKYSK